jgi:hypothetical protein
MQAIVVKYIGPTNSHGSKFKASAAKGIKPVTLAYDHSLSEQDNAQAACSALVRRLGWYSGANGEQNLYGSFWACATLPSGDYVFVNTYSTPHSGYIIDTCNW